MGLLVWGVVAVVSALGGEEKPPTANEQPQQPEPGQQPESEPESETASQSPEGMCAESDIELSAATDAASYTADQDPVLILQVKNASESECKINVGTSQQEFRVMSGSDRIFSTADCAERGGRHLGLQARTTGERALHLAEGTVGPRVQGRKRAAAARHLPVYRAAGGAGVRTEVL
ncbi:hypothetical protein [Arthrobacter sp. JCM 19049]|uniref:hypothetical protein n=1 Tax=Arthrobacter sp. JCM 19049 TaxID=1460643 RepID=UPI000AC65E6D|nr:hypothetical protein [Arthrobacter sp. JCM 19049]